MAKTESTAVNELIGLVQNTKPMASEPAADLFGTPPAGRQGRAASPAVASSHPARMTSTIPPMRGAGDVAPLPRARAPQSTAEQSIPSVRMSTAPATRGSTIPPLPPRAPTGTLPPATAPVAAPFESLPVALAKFSSPDLPLPRTDLVINSDETWVGTLPRGAERVALAKKLIIPGIACIAAGIALGFYVSGTKAKSSSNATPTTASAPSPMSTAHAAPTPAAPPTETVLHPTARSAESANAATSTAGGIQPEPPTKAEQAAQVAAVAAGDTAAGLTNDAPAEIVAKVAEAPKGVVTFTDVRIDTDPQGASITLVDRDKRFPLGSTPLSTSLDSSRQYDVVIELAGRPSQTVHLDPTTTSRLDISLGRKQRAAAPAVAPKAAAPEITAIEPKQIKAKAAIASDIDAIADEPAQATPKAAIAANGTLMVSSKPPCEIHIDGAATGLTTPQRSIELAPGKHKITFVNQEAGIKKTVSVTIKAGEPTKLIQDLMAK